MVIETYEQLVEHRTGMEGRFRWCPPDHSLGISWPFEEIPPEEYGRWPWYYSAEWERAAAKFAGIHQPFAVEFVIDGEVYTEDQVKHDDFRWRFDAKGRMRKGGEEVTLRVDCKHRTGLVFRGADQHGGTIEASSHRGAQVTPRTVTNGEWTLTPELQQVSTELGPRTIAVLRKGDQVWWEGKMPTLVHCENSLFPHTINPFATPLDVYADAVRVFSEVGAFHRMIWRAVGRDEAWGGGYLHHGGASSKWFTIGTPWLSSWGLWVELAASYHRESPQYVLRISREKLVEGSAYRRKAPPGAMIEFACEGDYPGDWRIKGSEVLVEGNCLEYAAELLTR